MSRRQAFLLFFVLILVWGINWPIMKTGLRTIPPLWFVAIRLTLGSACLFALQFLRGRGRLPLPSRRDLPILLSLGLVQIGIFNALSNLALQHVPAGRSAVLAYTTPIWVTPLAMFFLKERVGALKLSGVALGLAGVATLFNPFTFDWSDGAAALGNGLLLLAALLWAVVIIHVRAHKWHGTPFELAPWQLLVAAAPFWVAAYGLEGAPAFPLSGPIAAILLYNGPIATSFAFWAVVVVNRALPAVTTSIGLLGVPLTGALTAALALGEPLTATLLSGLALIVTGVVLMTLGDRRPALAPSQAAGMLRSSAQYRSRS